MNPIINVDEETIDISKVIRVSRLVGDPSYLRYTIYFINGHTIEVYEDRKDMGTQMHRDEFISRWRQFNFFGDQ